MAVTCGYGEELSGSINAGNFLTSCKVYWLASQEGLCSMETNVIFKCLNSKLEDKISAPTISLPIIFFFLERFPKDNKVMFWIHQDRPLPPSPLQALRNTKITDAPSLNLDSKH